MLATNENGLALQISGSQRLVAAMLAALIGSALLYTVAFANSDLMHNAAHDTRHAIVAPCH